MDGVTLMEKGFYHADRGYWQTTGDVPEHILASYPEGTVEITLKPGPDYEFDGDDWISVAPDATAVLSELRASTSITRRALCMACRDAGIFTNAEAVQATKGDWPPTLATALDGLTDDQKADAQMEWSDVQTVRRTAPLILLLQWYLDFTDAQVDALFGIGGENE